MADKAVNSVVMVLGKAMFRTGNGKIVVGPRAFLDLKGYLTEDNLFKECIFCKNPITAGHVQILSNG